MDPTTTKRGDPGFGNGVEPDPIGTSEVLCIVTSLVCWMIFIYVLTTGNNRIRKAVLGGDGEFKWNTLRKEHVTHPARGMSTTSLAVMRFAFVAGVLSVYVYVGWDKASGILYAFTGWSWSVIGVYFVLAGIATFTSSESTREEPATSFHCFIWALFQVVTVSAVFVTVIVYLVLMPSVWIPAGFDAMMAAFYLNVPSFVMHHFNVIFMLVEAYCNRMTFCRTHVLFGLVYGNTYIVFTWWYYFNDGLIIYFFLDIRDSFTWISYLLLMATLYGFFVLVMKFTAPCLKRGVDEAILPSCRTNLELEALAS